MTVSMTDNQPYKMEMREPQQPTQPSYNNFEQPQHQVDDLDSAFKNLNFLLEKTQKETEIDDFKPNYL